MLEDGVISESLDMLFNHLRDRSAYFFYGWYWWAENPQHVEMIRDAELAHRRRYPGHRFIHCCNTLRQQDVFTERGLDAIFCNHNALVDERIFYPQPETPKQYDAIYDARLKEYKRHYLAAQVRNLALLYAYSPAFDVLAQMQQIRLDLAQAHWFNHQTSEQFGLLTPAEVNRALNSSRVGLCLSETEGAMFASIQYLLAGLPIVSTASNGGRDVFFDDESALLVDSTPEAVAAGVDEMIRRNPAPTAIRARALEKMYAHRQTLIARVQRIYDSENVKRDFAAEWDVIFFNKLAHGQSHRETIRRLRQGSTT